MRCLYPLAAVGEVADDVRAADTANEANRAPDGVGWTDVHVIASPEHDYAEAGLRLDQADAALSPILPRVRRFAATASAGFRPDAHDPYGTHEDEAHCYGLDATCFLKLEAGGSLVRQVWFHVETLDAERLAQLREAIVALDQLVPSIIADYWLNSTGVVRDGDFLDRYLRALSNGD
ncbi:hypothetical protein SAMN05216223_11054 [Actinacidiphila yanglinensis]|uniref:Uncharacterized protein n=2 Tax=Actinacidiphila yanglinensis TaxID=310779 RepID=A0A1H6CTX5_9ACTN|nr:hypothetical protein SAMN05216223_11054 [Actinacidiphila yanglinensis]